MKNESTARASISTMRELIDGSAEKFGEKTFIKFLADSKIVEKTYKNVRDDSLAVCRYLRARFGEHSRIAIMAKTNYEYITAMTGALLSGNIIVPLSYELSAENAAALIKHSDSGVLFCDNPSQTREIELLCPDLVCEMLSESVFDDIYKNYGENSKYAALSEFTMNPDECALIMYTSGTTGEMKGVMLSMRAIISNTDFRELSFSSDDVTLSVLPMHHIFCFSSDYLKNIKDGVTVCLNGGVGNIGANLLRFEPSVIRLVPVMTNSLLRLVGSLRAREPELSPRAAAERVFGRRIRWITSSGAYLSPSVINEYEKMGIRVRQAYGMTEAGPRISVPDGETSPESVGRVISNCEIRIRNGEIQVKSPGIMMGYYKNPEATAQALTEDGFLRTGDIGYVTADRQLFITGRSKNLIILSNGENVSPEQIENKYAEEPLIREMLVYEKDDMIAADIYPDYVFAEGNGIKDIEQAVGEVVKRINMNDMSSHEISVFNILAEPLARTGSGKLIRKKEE